MNPMMNQKPNNFPLLVNPMMPFAANPAMPVIPSNDATLYVGNLSPYIEESRLSTHFQPFGQVISCKIMRDIYTYESRKFGFVSFATVQEAQRAKDEMNYKVVDGFELRVFFKRLPSEFKPEANIFVRNLPGTVNTQQLEDLCRTFGKVASCSVRTDDNGMSLGYGYVQFEEEEGARKAVEGLEGQEHWGVKIQAKKFVASKNRAIEKKNLYIKNFPRAWDTSRVEKELADTFGQHGKIVCSGVYEFKPEEGKTLFYAFVAYESEEAAKAALTTHNGKFLEENAAGEQEEPLFVDYVVPKRFRKARTQKDASTYQNNTNLYVKSLKADVTEEKLRAAFEKFGKITSIEVKSCKPSFLNGEVLNFAFVNFATADEATEAYIKAKHDADIQDMVHSAHSKTADFIFYHQPKSIRTQYVRMKKRMQQSMALSNMMQMSMMRPQGFPGGPRKPRFNKGGMGQGPMPFMMPRGQGFPFPGMAPEMPMFPNMQVQSPSTYNNSVYNNLTPSSTSNPGEKKEIYNVDWLKQNKKEFLNFDKEKQSNLMGNLMYSRVSNSGLAEKSAVPKITGMLIDLDILDYEEIIDILLNDESLKERINEAVEVINETE